MALSAFSTLGSAAKTIKILDVYLFVARAPQKVHEQIKIAPVDAHDEHGALRVGSHGRLVGGMRMDCCFLQ